MARPEVARRKDPLVVKPELGIKRTCPECAARFYDLCKMPCECPKCEHSFEPEILLKSKKRIIEPDKPAAKPAAKPEAKPEAESEDDEEATGVEEVSAEGMSQMPAEVDEDGLAVTPDEEDTVVAEVDADIEAAEDDDDNTTLVSFDDDDSDVAAIIDTDIDKMKDDS